MAKRKLPPGLSEYFAKIGKAGGLRGGHARAKTMTAKERAASASNAAKARWAKAEKP
jgi:hypothetical protein